MVKLWYLIELLKGRLLLEFPRMFMVTNVRGMFGIKRNVGGINDVQRWDRSAGKIRKVGKKSL